MKNSQYSDFSQSIGFSHFLEIPQKPQNIMVNHNNQQTESLVDSDIFSSSETAWSNPIRCTFGCGNQVTFNKEIVGRGGEQIPHLTPDKQHFCPIGYRNFFKLDAATQAENRIVMEVKASK